MADPLIVLVLLTAADAKDATSPAMTSAARRALGARAVVLVDERPELPGDADALAVAANVHARGVVEVVWADTAHERARLRVHVGDEWIDRELRFAPEDSPAERGRTLGLALATMITERAPPAEPPPSPPEPAPAPTPAPAPPPDVVPPPSPERRGFGIDVLGVGAVGLGGEAAGAGGGLAARVYASDAIGARAGAAARFGSLPAADASTYAITLSAGGASRLVGGGAFAAGVRADLLLTRFAARREGLERSRWITGADLLLEGDVRFAEDTYLVGALGGEVVFGPTDVDVGGAPMTRVPVARLVAELGVRRRF